MTTTIKILLIAVLLPLALPVLVIGGALALGTLGIAVAVSPPAIVLVVAFIIFLVWWYS